MGLVTLACISCVNGMQLREFMRMIKRDDTKMEEDSGGKQLFCVVCGELNN